MVTDKDVERINEYIINPKKAAAPVLPSRRKRSSKYFAVPILILSRQILVCI
jgi:hypothetical protein